MREKLKTTFIPIEKVAERYDLPLEELKSWVASEDIKSFPGKDKQKTL